MGGGFDFLIVCCCMCFILLANEKIGIIIGFFNKQNVFVVSLSLFIFKEKI